MSSHLPPTRCFPVQVEPSQVTVMAKRDGWSVVREPGYKIEEGYASGEPTGKSEEAVGEME